MRNINKTFYGAQQIDCASTTRYDARLLYHAGTAPHFSSASNANRTRSHMNRPHLHQKIFLSLLVIITLAFFWLLLPFSGAIFWAFIFAVLFTPLFNRIQEKMPEKRTLAAILTLLCCLLLAIFPLTLIILSLAGEGEMLYRKILSGEIDFNRTFMEIYSSLPEWISRILQIFGVSDIGDLQQKTADSLMQASRTIAGKVFTIGQNIFGFGVGVVIMLYLLFFLFRDGKALGHAIHKAIPLGEQQKHELLVRFTGVIRATVKGNLIVVIVQGALGGLIFWILGIQAPVLWGAVMAFLSLFPAGASLIWIPAAIYLLCTGAIIKGVIMIAFCAVVIGLVDNLLRPLLVGKDTQMPDYLVLISTLGGLSLFGLNGFVIGPVIAALFMTSWKMFSGIDAPATGEITAKTHEAASAEIPD
ncbi:AI-2E family transporter [Oxalobacter sp. OttesenSCG-928-P03]|nr:AI-2E family transporter [Oxalobacter sp. OttesenSCG-928-P03]